MAFRYLYIDDEVSDSLSGYIDAVQGDAKLIEIDARRPDDFPKGIGELARALDAYDGLILDWRLDQKSSWDFRAGAIAQELRTRATEADRKKADRPIVLWSALNKLEKSYFKDNTSQDLFEAIYVKDNVVEEADRIREQLASFADAYKRIAAVRGRLATVLGLPIEHLNELDAGLRSELATQSIIPVHKHARFIFRQLIERPGALIPEPLLAARLGINPKSEGWSKLLETLPAKAAYSGPFADGWSRWWAHIVEQHWWGEIGVKTPLSRLDASSRVKHISLATGIPGLEAAEPLELAVGTRFWTVCEHFKEALDPADGVFIDEPDPAPWQVRRYLSILAAIERYGRPGLMPHPREIPRIRAAQSALEATGGSA